MPRPEGARRRHRQFIFTHDGNILHFEQHQAGENRFYLARIEWDLASFTLPLADFSANFAPIADKFSMHWKLALSSHRPRVAIFVSKYDHCLVDLLYRQRNGELACEIALIISNHLDAKRDADFYRFPYQDIPLTKETKKDAEAQQLALLQKNNIDFIVLARYMQVLSGISSPATRSKLSTSIILSCLPSSAASPINKPTTPA